MDTPGAPKDTWDVGAHVSKRPVTECPPAVCQVGIIWGCMACAAAAAPTVSPPTCPAKALCPTWPWGAEELERTLPPIHPAGGASLNVDPVCCRVGASCSEDPDVFF